MSEMLALDAMEGVAPSVWAVLTTRTPDVDPRRFYDSRRLVMRAIRRRWPAAEYFCLVEFTTGYGPRSSGLRRPHWNLLIKGVPASDLDALRDVIVKVWCAREDAKAAAQFVGEVAEVGGLMRYLALHFLKESQQPPKGWSGQRANASKGYFARPRWQVRRDAMKSLRLKRAIRQRESEGLRGGEALMLAELDVLRAEQVRWECIVLSIDHETGEVIRGRPLRGGEVEAWRQPRARNAADDALIASMYADVLPLGLEYESALADYQRALDTAQLRLGG